MERCFNTAIAVRICQSSHWNHLPRGFALRPGLLRARPSTMGIFHAIGLASMQMAAYQHCRTIHQLSHQDPQMEAAVAAHGPVAIPYTNMSGLLKQPCLP